MNFLCANQRVIDKYIFRFEKYKLQLIIEY